LRYKLGAAGVVHLHVKDVVSHERKHSSTMVKSPPAKHGTRTHLTQWREQIEQMSDEFRMLWHLCGGLF